MKISWTWSTNSSQTLRKEKKRVHSRKLTSGIYNRSGFFPFSYVDFFLLLMLAASNFFYFLFIFCFFVIRPFFLRSDEFGRRSFLWGWHRSFEWVRSSFVHARTTSVVRMSSFVVLSCKGDITRSDESVRRSFLRGWHRSFRWVRSSFVHAFVVVVVVFIVAVAAVTEPSYLAWTYFVWML